MAKRFCSCGRLWACMQRSIQRVVLWVASSNLQGSTSCELRLSATSPIQFEAQQNICWAACWTAAYRSGLVFTLETTSSSAMMMSAPAPQPRAAWACMRRQHITSTACKVQGSHLPELVNARTQPVLDRNGVLRREHHGCAVHGRLELHALLHDFRQVQQRHHLQCSTCCYVRTGPAFLLQRFNIWGSWIGQQTCFGKNTDKALCSRDDEARSWKSKGSV